MSYGRDLDFTPYLKERVTKPAADKAPDIVVLDADVSAVEQKNYDLMGDLLDADILSLFRQVLREEESVVKIGGQEHFGYLVRMSLTNIGAMNDRMKSPSVKEYCLVPVWLSLIYILPSTMRR